MESSAIFPCGVKETFTGKSSPVKETFTGIQSASKQMVSVYNGGLVQKKC